MRRGNPTIRSLLICASIAVQGACVAPSREVVEEARDGGTRYLFSASTVIEDEWQQLRFLGITQYRVELYRDRLAISARGRRSSSGLMRRVEIDTAQCPEMEWSWAVTALQPSADIRIREREDVGATTGLCRPSLTFDRGKSPFRRRRALWLSNL